MFAENLSCLTSVNENFAWTPLSSDTDDDRPKNRIFIVTVMPW